LKRRSYPNRNSRDSLSAQSPTRKLQNVKIKELSGAKVKSLASDTFINNDTDNDEDAPTSDYIQQATDLVSRTNNLQMLPSGGPWPSSIGLYQVSIPASETVIILAENLYEQDSATPDLANPLFSGVIQVHGLSIYNSTGGGSMTVFLNGGGGDGKDDTASNSMRIVDKLAIGSGESQTLNLGSIFSGGMYVAKESGLILQNLGANALVVTINYSVYSYGGAFP